MAMMKLEEAGTQKVHEKANVQGDKMNIVLLLFLYTLQGGLYGFTLALPIFFQKRNVSYVEQAEFSLAIYPYCFKLLFAPLVDCIFSEKFGRRKTWIIPMQYLMGLSLFFVSMNMDDWLGSEDGTKKPNINFLSLVFFMAMFFSSLQDIALDGWSLTMLQKRNIGYAGTCQSIGARTGDMLTYILPIILDSKDICNLFRSVPQNYGFVSLANFMMFWSVLFILATTLILIFKKDNSLEIIDDENCECKLSPKESYQYLWELCKLRPIMIFSLILLTFNVGFGPQVGVAPLKMIEAGVPGDKFALLTVFAVPLQITLSVLLRRRLFGPRSMHAFMECCAVQLILNIVLGVGLFVSYSVQDENEKLPVWYICFLLVIHNIRTAFKNLMFSAQNAFFCRVSDPQFGGIYMTFLNTVVNIGSNWPVTLSLWIVDLLRVEICGSQVPSLMKNSCMEIDGFYTETVIFTALGAIWLWWSRTQIIDLQNTDASRWIVKRKNTPMIVEEENFQLTKNGSHS